jgi:hypothetical protein
MARTQKFLNHCRAHEPRGASNEYTHEQTPSL